MCSPDEVPALLHVGTGHPSQAAWVSITLFIMSKDAYEALASCFYIVTVYLMTLLKDARLYKLDFYICCDTFFFLGASALPVEPLGLFLMDLNSSPRNM